MTTKFTKLEKFEGVDFRRSQKKMHFLLTTLKVVYVLSTPMPAVMEDETVISESEIFINIGSWVKSETRTKVVLISRSQSLIQKNQRLSKSNRSMSERVTRSRSIVNPELEPDNEVIAEERMTDVNPTAIQGKSRGRPKGKTVQKAATQVRVSNVGTRGGKTSRGIRQNENVEVRIEQETSNQESSTSVRGQKQTGNRGRGRT
ncbi:hypothetical protein L6452_37807 [Arctium lappa]|uniref:Uncharacterized protein n=1 Tax=Arctium lappa TaxID=4217 RepID=A0ACB8Y400_ARCLA|nr:hypothetical protein L6452_37807 [Arctium lappa]